MVEQKYDWDYSQIFLDSKIGYAKCRESEFRGAGYLFVE
jgi:hypothetical protein